MRGPWPSLTVSRQLVRDLTSRDNQWGFYFRSFEKPLKCWSIETEWMNGWVNEWFQLLDPQGQEFFKWKESEVAFRHLFFLNKYCIPLLSSPLSCASWGRSIWLTGAASKTAVEREQHEREAFPDPFRQNQAFPALCSCTAQHSPLGNRYYFELWVFSQTVKTVNAPPNSASRTLPSTQWALNKCFLGE